MQNAVYNLIIENNLLNKTVLVGLSGGVDSTVLCDILSKIKNIKLIAIHLNHNWRGDESKRDEIFAYEFARERNVKFYSETLNSDKKTETNARELRYKFFENAKEKFKADAVFLAHNKNDNVETLIYRLIKGTGPRGLSSIPKIRDFYYRPLLDFERYEIEKYAKDNNVKHIFDSSNSNTKYKRNLIREEIFPKMKEINKEVVNSLSNFIEINKMTQKIVDNAYNNALSLIKQDNYFIRNDFLKLSVEMQFEIINRFLQNILKNRDYKTITRIVNFIQNNNSSKISINSELFLKIYDNKIYLVENSTKKDAFQILKEGENHFLNYKITVVKTSMPENLFQKNKNKQFVNLDFKNEYILRTRKDGDKIQAFGTGEIQKLKTYLIKKKIPSELRDNIPLIAINDEVLAFGAISISEKLRVDKNQKNCYKLIIEKEI